MLLRGVNDNLETMRQLMRALLRVKIRPYYLFHCDPVTGAGHFRTSIWKGLEIMEGLRGHMSGLAVPTYVVDSPHGGGKIPLMPNYLVSASDDCVVLRNYEGMLIRYQAEDKPTTVEPTVTRGVSQLVQGTKTMLVPEHTERMDRRRKTKKADEPRNGVRESQWQQSQRLASQRQGRTAICRSRSSREDLLAGCPWRSRPYRQPSLAVAAFARMRVASPDSRCGYSRLEPAAKSEGWSLPSRRPLGDDC